MLRNASNVFLVLFLLCGCTAVQDFGSSLKYNIQGEYYLQGEKFDQGSQVFIEAVEKDPNNPEAHYYYGRFLLAKGKKKTALHSFKKAVNLQPDKSDYYFWLGVTYGELGQEGRERSNYQMALRYDKRNIQALTYLGNNLLRAKKYSQALGYYEKALDLWPYSPQALYNRAVILRKLRRTPEEKLAWLQYLEAYPSGSFARRAADRLNGYGDASYRNHKLGIRTVTLARIAFVPFKAELADGALPSLDLLGTMASNIGRGKLNVLVYQLNNRNLAQKRAISIRDYLYKEYPSLKKRNSIRLSWFDVAEKRKVLGKTVIYNESVRFFLSDL